MLDTLTFKIHVIKFTNYRSNAAKTTISKDRSSKISTPLANKDISFRLDAGLRSAGSLDKKKEHFIEMLLADSHKPDTKFILPTELEKLEKLN